MASDDLHQPLGLPRALARKRTPRSQLRLILLVILGAVAVSCVLFIYWLGDPIGGTPQVKINVGWETPSAPPSPKSSPADQAIPRTGLAMIESAADIEQKSGVKVIRMGGGSAPSAMIIEVPHTLDVALTPAPDRRLIESSRYGLLPRIGPDGSRPAEVYARPVIASAAEKDAPRIVLIVGAMGLSSSLTKTAIASLPGAVTLAFAPYGKNLETSVAEARARGHEVILQLPMEPIDYPQTNPGPHTLLTTATTAENEDSLHWLLGRFTGYTGVANFLGAKFTADQAAFSPILREIAERGLIYADDGSSPQSLAPSLAANSGLATATADVILDGTPDGIDAELIKLEAIARDKGVAVGIASALPESVEKISRFAHAADAHGLMLIPLSAAVSKSGPIVGNRDP